MMQKKSVGRIDEHLSREHRWRTRRPNAHWPIRRAHHSERCKEKPTGRMPTRRVPVKERAEGTGAGSFASRQWAQSNHITVKRLRHTTRIVDQIFPEPAIAPTYECAARAGQGFIREGSQRIAALSARSLL
jgi:hypothetical protein